MSTIEYTCWHRSRGHSPSHSSGASTQPVAQRAYGVGGKESVPGAGGPGRWARAPVLTGRQRRQPRKNSRRAPCQCCRVSPAPTPPAAGTAGSAAQDRSRGYTARQDRSRGYTACQDSTPADTRAAAEVGDGEVRELDQCSCDTRFTGLFQRSSVYGFTVFAKV